MKKRKKRKKEKIAEKLLVSKGLNEDQNKIIKNSVGQNERSKSQLQNSVSSSIGFQFQFHQGLIPSQTQTNVISKVKHDKTPCFQKTRVQKTISATKKAETRAYWNYKISTGFSVPDFLHGQKQSFKNFLTYGLIQELNLYGWFSMRLEDIHSTWAFYNGENEFIKMPLDNSIDVIFHGDHYKLTKPKLSPRKAILSRRTYSSQLYVPIQINLHWTKEVFVYWFLLANLPMMTKKGHFIINGNPRVILNQIIRRPGIYFKTVEKKKSSIYVADIIAQRGTWLRLEINHNKKDPSKGRIWAKLKKLKRFSVSLLLSDLGLSQAFFDYYLKSIDLLGRFKDDPIFQNTFSGKATNIQNFLKTEVKPWVSTLNSRQGYFRKKFSNAYAYSLSQSGRQHLNQTLGLNLPINHTTLTGEDILLGCCQLIDYFNGSQKSSDIDDLKNRKLRPTGELIQQQMAVGLLQLREGVLETLNKQTDKKGVLWKNREINDSYNQRKNYFQSLISNSPVNTALKSFFATNPLSQFLDQTNALSELTHKRRISSLGEGGIQRDTATMAVRGIHPSHYGRICPIETPEGQNAGLVNSFTAYANLNALGLIETPFYTVYKGMVIKEKATMFSSEQEKNFVIAPGDVSMTKDHCLVSKKLPVRQSDRFNRVLPNQINFMAVDPLQMISIATSLIPFLEHDDGNRALMGSNMQRQAVPTLITAAPIVGTGFESRVLSDSCVGIQAKSSGFVSYVDNQKIILYRPCLRNVKSKTLKKGFKFKRLINSKLNSQLLQSSKNLKSINDQKPFNTLIKQVSKVNLFGHTNQIKQINLNQIQLHHHFDLIHHHAYFSLWLIFSDIAKQSLVKKNNFGNPTHLHYHPAITQIALTLLQQTYNVHYFNHYFILLLHQVFYASQDISYFNGWLKPKSNKLQLFVDFMNPQTFQKQGSFKNKSKIEIEKFKKSSQNLQNSRCSNKNVKTLIKAKIKSGYDIETFENFDSLVKTNTKTIITPYMKEYTNDRLKAILEDNTNPTASTGLKNLSFFLDSNKTLKTGYSSTLLQKNLNKVINNDLEADAFTKPTFATTLNQIFYMPLFESNPTFDSKLESKSESHAYPHAQSHPRFINTNKDAVNEINTTSPKKLITNKYNLLPYFRSNQDTPLAQKPVVSEGQWVEKGDTLVDTRSSLNGELAIGQNLLVGYTPWEGYNFEDAVLLNQRVISEDLLTTIHIERYEINFNDTRYGAEYIPNLTLDDFKNTDEEQLDYLDSGIIKVGTWVEENMILVRKFTPIELKQQVSSVYEKLAHKVLQMSEQNYRDTSIRVPAHVSGRIIHVEIMQEFKENKAQIVHSVEQTNKTANTYQNLNLLPKRLGFKISDLQKQKLFKFELKLKAFINKKAFLNNIYSKSQMSKNRQYYSWSQKETSFLNKKMDLNFSLIKASKRIKTFSKLNKQQNLNLNLNQTVLNQAKRMSSVKKVEIYIAEQRKVQIGDKIAGRHGNKGIISAILPRQDMPYLPDGSVLDIVLNPLGVPSRMNVGQIFECLLGLAGSYLNQVYKIQPFDETYGIEASRSLVYSKLYEARLKTNQSWLFNPNYPGKVRLFDGRTGQCFAQPVTVGKAYILKLIHLVDEKIHARSTGPYSVITQQPLRGRSKQGGQRVGEMEVWAFEGFGAAYILQELLTIKSDDMENRKNLHYNLLNNKDFSYGLPESFNVLTNELKCLCLNMTIGKYKKLPLIYSGLTAIYNSRLRKPKRWPFS